MKKRYSLIVLWAFAVGLICLCLQSLDLNQAWIEFSRADPFWLFLAVFLNACILVTWTFLWHLLLPGKLTVPLFRVFQSNAFMSTSCNTIPFPGGHAMGVIALARGTGVGHSIALSVLALDQLLEGFAKVFVLTLVAAFVPLPELMRQGILLFVVIIGFFALIMFYLAHSKPGKIEEPLTFSFLARVRILFSRWSGHLETLRDLRTFSFGLLLALLMMGCQTLAIWAVQKSLGLNLLFWAPILVMGALNLATVLPVTPGNFGVYEGTAFLAYQFCGLTPESAMSLALLQHICFLVPMVGTGYLVLLFPIFTQRRLLAEKTIFQTKLK